MNIKKKLNLALRRVKDVVVPISFIAFIIMALLTGFVVGFFILGVVKAFVGMVCWNIAIPAMFGLPKITLFQAFILSFTIDYLRSNYFFNIKSNYIENQKYENISNVWLIITIITVEIVSILIAVGLTMYSWNNILPQLLNIDLVQINFWQAFGFACLFNMIFGFSKSDKEISKKDKNEETKRTDNIESETTVETKEKEVKPTETEETEL